MGTMISRLFPAVITGIGVASCLLSGCSQGSSDAFRVQNKEPAAATSPTPPPPPGQAQPVAPANEQQRRPVAMPPGIARPEDVTGEVAPAVPTSGSATQGAQAPGAGGQAAPQEQGQYVKADVGVGKKGASLQQPGILTTPVFAYFRSQEQMAFRIQVPQALNLFEAEHGYKPRSHEEFWQEIIVKNNIRLPELPPGHRYVYDPQRGELMVEIPAGSAAP